MTLRFQMIYLAPYHISIVRGSRVKRQTVLTSYSFRVPDFDPCLGYLLCGISYVLLISAWDFSGFSCFLPPPKNLLVGGLAKINSPMCKKLCIASHAGSILLLCLVILGSALDPPYAVLEFFFHGHLWFTHDMIYKSNSTEMNLILMFRWDKE